MAAVVISLAATAACGGTANANDWSDEKCSAQRLLVLSDSGDGGDAGTYNFHCCKYDISDDEIDTVDEAECRP